jgi:DMSO/TMAO reductase YedYZ heme-binding membrane subunit
MNPSIWWYLSRASGFVALGLLFASLIWGVLLTTRILRSIDRPAWLLDLHRWLGGLALTFTLVHMATLMLDHFVSFSLKDLLIPMASDWQPGPIAWGVVAFWLLLAVQLSSLIMKKLGRKTWRRIHLLAYPMLWLTIMHAGLAGTDIGNPVYRVSVTLAIILTVFVTAFRLLPVPARKKTSPVLEKQEPPPTSSNE